MKKQRGERYSEAEREKILQAYKASGLGITVFCRQQGYNKGTLLRWLTAAGKTQVHQESETTSGFAPLQVETPPSTSRLHIQYPSGVSVSIDGTVEASVLRTLLQSYV